MSVFEPSFTEVVRLLQHHLTYRRLQYFDIPDKYWDYDHLSEKETLNLKGSTVMRLENIHPETGIVQLVDMHTNIRYESLCSILYTSRFVNNINGDPLKKSTEIKRLNIPDDTNANIRAYEFARIVRTICGQCDSSLVATLDGRLRNATYLVRKGVPASSVVVIECNPLVAFYQRLVQIGTDLEDVNIVLGNAQTLFSSNAPVSEMNIADCGRSLSRFSKYHGGGQTWSSLRDRIVGFNLDFCGSLPTWVNSSFCDNFPNVRVWGFTAGVRNNTRRRKGKDMIPTLNGLLQCRSYQHGQVVTKFFVREKEMCTDTIDITDTIVYQNTMLEIVGKWVSSTENSNDPGRTYFLVLHTDDDNSGDVDEAKIEMDWFEDIELFDGANELIDDWGRRERTFYYRNKHISRKHLLVLYPVHYLIQVSNVAFDHLIKTADKRYAEERS
jgi:hypothetical protein